MKTILFFDDFLINRQRNIERRWHQPEWLPQYLFIDRETLFGGGYSSVVPAPDSGYLLYYMAMLSGGDQPDNSAVICMARSPDALRWEKAVFTPARHATHPQVVYTGNHVPHGCHIYHDPEETDPARRYKMTNFSHTRPHIGRLLYSANGTDWQLDDKHSFIDWQSDTQLHMLRNPVTNRYQINLRGFPIDRRIFRIESDDLKTWSKPRLVLHPNPLDPPMRLFYGMPQFRYGDMFLGLLWCYDTFDEPGLFKMSGMVETELAYSYDGLTWNRTHRPFMTRQPMGQYGSGSIYGSVILEQGDDLLVHAVASLEEHQRALGRKAGDAPFNGLLPGRLKRDRFVGLASRVGQGELTTDALYPRGPELSLNLCAPQGSVRVQICDSNCKPLPGYTFEDCEELRGDGLVLRPRWRERADLGAAIAMLREKGYWPKGWCRVQIQMEMAELFSINGDFGVLPISGGTGQDRLCGNYATGTSV